MNLEWIGTRGRSRTFELQSSKQGDFETRELRMIRIQERFVLMSTVESKTKSNPGWEDRALFGSRTTEDCIPSEISPEWERVQAEALG